MTLEEAVKKCRELGLVRFRGHVSTHPSDGLSSHVEVEFDLGPAPAQVESEFKVPEVDNPVESVKSAKKRGKDGLTAAEQFEIYGVVIDAEE